jgi:hypothetical protein
MKGQELIDFLKSNKLENHNIEIKIIDESRTLNDLSDKLIGDAIGCYIEEWFKNVIIFGKRNLIEKKI